MISEVKTDLAEGGKTLNIHIEGRFDFNRHQQFREAYETVFPKPKQFNIDLLKTSYLDSSALGMLLLLRGHAGGDSAQVRIINSNPDVRKILAISNFDKLFDVS